jgi:hypothetical protein
MTTDRLRDVCQAQPFRPFTMHLADGRRIPVCHREFLLSSPSGRTVVVYQPDDLLNIVDMLLVTDLEIKPNGGTSRQRSRKRT